MAPLVENGIVNKNANLSAFSLTGYSGGGKKMIAEYEDTGRDSLLDAPRMYGISQKHKHLPEMGKICGLENAPAFCPIVAPYYAGMEVTIPLFAEQVKGGVAAIREIYKEYYKGNIVFFNENASENGFLSAKALEYKDSLEISVHGNDDNMILVARFDNLGKGASGAAIQNMNIVLGFAQEKGLTL